MVPDIILEMVFTLKAGYPKNLPHFADITQEIMLLHHVLVHSLKGNYQQGSINVRKAEG